MSAPRERPIIFGRESIAAILAGRKTQTRRLVGPRPADGVVAFIRFSDGFKPIWSHDALPEDNWANRCIRCPYGEPGDRLWVRETFRRTSLRVETISEVRYRTDCIPTIDGFLWRPSIFMPRWASRILLEVSEVRVERLQEITEADAKAEGIDFLGDGAARYGILGNPASWSDSARSAFVVGWDTINGKRGPWASDPWVWAVTFQVVAP